MKWIFLSVWVASLGSAASDSFEELFREIAPPEGEAWRSIPWEIDLLEAQAIAAKSGKPLFIWAMDGHPLGCT